MTLGCELDLMIVPSTYEVWLVGLRNKMSCPGERVRQGLSFMSLAMVSFLLALFGNQAIPDLFKVLAEGQGLSRSFICVVMEDLMGAG